MRLLHLGSGFRPWRGGGLVAYVEDLIDQQVLRGHEVSYFFSGRQYPLLRRPRLRRWERGGVKMLEVVNSPLYDHGRQPELELSEPAVERLLQGVLDEIRPDVVHVQELAGLPSSVLDVVRRSGTPAIVTLQDYFPLCSTFKLIDAEGQVCLRREIGADCMATVAADTRDSGLLIDATIRFELKRLPGLHRFDPHWTYPRINRLSTRLGKIDASRRERMAQLRPELFQRRRELNVERLNGAHRVIAMSRRVEEIYAQMGVDRERLRTIHLTLGHIEGLTPRRREPGKPLTFGTLAGFESVAKGGALLLDALRRLSAAVPDGRFRMLVFGRIEPRFAKAAEGLPGVEVRGPYRAHQLDAMLDEIDVGILPSIWEEAYGYAGVEFLAKGIPVLANAIGGMTDYTIPGETGWLNRSRSAAELARIMQDVIDRPDQIAELNAKLLAAHDSIVKPIARHTDEMDEVYREAVSGRVA